MRSDGRKDADDKKARCFRFWTTGQGRNLLKSACDDIDRLRRLDAVDAGHHKEMQVKRAKVYADQAQKFAGISGTLDGIIRGSHSGDS